MLWPDRARRPAGNRSALLASVSTDNVVDVKEDGKAALFIFRTNESGEWCIKSVFTTSPPFTYPAFPHTLREGERNGAHT